MLEILRQIRSWLALQEMWGLNPFYSPSLVSRIVAERAVAAMGEEVLGYFHGEGQTWAEGIAAGIISSEEGNRRMRLTVNLIDWRRGGY